LWLISMAIARMSGLVDQSGLLRLDRCPMERPDRAEAGAAGLKFLHHLQQSLPGTSSRKAALKP
jgi:hypothetical protein